MTAQVALRMYGLIIALTTHTQCDRCADWVGKVQVSTLVLTCCLVLVNIAHQQHWLLFILASAPYCLMTALTHCVTGVLTGLERFKSHL